MRTARPASKFTAAVAGLIAVVAAPAAAAAAIEAPTGWSRDTSFTSYHAWAEFTSATGTPRNVPDVAGSPATFPSPATNAVLPNAYDASGKSFLTGGKNIYSFAAPTNIKVDLPSYNLGAGYVTTVLVQTRSLGSVPSAGSARISYPGSPTTYGATDWGTLSSAPNTGMGGADQDTGFIFRVPTSPDSLKIEFDAATSSMSLDLVTVDTVVTRANPGSPLLPDMEPTIGYPSQPVPEPTGAALLGLSAVGLLGRRRRAR